MESGAGILGVEPPVDGGLGNVAFRNQGQDFPLQRRFIAESPPETGAGQHSELDLRHVQPTPVLGRLEELQPPCNPTGIWRWEGFVQRHRAVGGSGRPAPLAPPGPPDRLHPPASPGLTDQKQVASALPAVLLVLPHRSSRLGGYLGPAVGKQLGGGLVEADHRPLRVGGFGVQI